MSKFDFVAGMVPILQAYIAEVCGKDMFLTCTCFIAWLFSSYCISEKATRQEAEARASASHCYGAGGAIGLYICFVMISVL